MLKKPQKKQKTTFYLSKIKLDFPPPPQKKHNNNN